MRKQSKKKREKKFTFEKAEQNRVHVARSLLTKLGENTKRTIESSSGRYSENRDREDEQFLICVRSAATNEIFGIAVSPQLAGHKLAADARSF